MSADVTKELLIKIGSEGGENVFPGMDISADRLMGRVLGLNAAWELFNKITGLAKRGIDAIWSAGEQLTSTASTFEQLEIRFRTIFGGAGPAQNALDWAVKFAAVTPMTLEDVTAKMLKLKAYGFDPMSGILETIGDASFALGADFDGIVVALGQMQLKGKVVQQELNQLSERNIPAIKWLQEEFHLTAKQMENIGAQGIKADAAIAAILRRMEKEYAGGMRRASDSWLGAISTIQDTWIIFQKRIMDSGPFAFLVSNIRQVRDAFSEWAEFSGANLGFRIGGMITQYLEQGKALILDQIIPATQTLTEMGYNLLRTVTPIWNGLMDIGGIIGGPIMAGVRAILGVTGEIAGTFDLVMGFLRGTIPLGVGFLVEKFGDLAIAGEEVWLRIKNAALTTLNDIKLLIGTSIADFASSAGGTSIMEMMGFTTSAIDGITKLGLTMRDEANANTAALYAAFQAGEAGIRGQREIWGSFSQGFTSDLVKMMSALSGFKINASDPFGLSGLKGTSGDAEGHTLWQKGVNERTNGKVLWESEGSKKDGNKLDVNFGTASSDPILKAIIDLLNRVAKTEGTIGGAF